MNLPRNGPPCWVLVHSATPPPRAEQRLNPMSSVPGEAAVRAWMPSIQTAAGDLDPSREDASGSTGCSLLCAELCLSARCQRSCGGALSSPGSEGRLASARHSLSTEPLILQRATNTPTHQQMPCLTSRQIQEPPISPGDMTPSPKN